LETWINACNGIKTLGEKNCPKLASIIIPPPTLATDVMKEVMKEINEKITMISNSVIF